MARKITLRNVKTVRPDRTDSFLWDTEIKGFGLKTTPSGSKVYVLQYRMGGRGTPVRRYTIGRHGAPWTPDKAREEALRLLGRVADGADPAHEKSQARKDLTIGELCDFYLTEGCNTKKPSTLAIDRSNIERHIKPLLGKKKLGNLARADIERFLRDVAAGKTAADIRRTRPDGCESDKASDGNGKIIYSDAIKPRGRAVVEGGKAIATRSVAVLGAVLSFAVRRGLRADNPVRGVKLFKGQHRERFLSAPEIARLGEALTAAEREGVNPVAIAAIRLLLLTGARRGEILTAQRDWVDFERAALRLPDSKSGPKWIPLGAPALKIIAGLPEVEGNPYLLPGEGKKHFVGLPRIWRRIADKAGLTGVRIHDLRHSFASVAIAGGDSLFLVGKVLGHRQARTTEVYAHLQNDPVLAVADRAANTIAAALAGGRGGKVVALKQVG